MITTHILKYIYIYIYINNIGTSSLELDEVGAIISYEEYHPYGTTSYQAMNNDINSVAKRYRFVGKERDEENGFYYIGARFYAPWLSRWISCDPINSEFYNFIHDSPNRNKSRHFDELSDSPYEYCYSNPITFIDPDGEQVRKERIFRKAIKWAKGLSSGGVWWGKKF